MKYKVPILISPESDAKKHLDHYGKTGKMMRNEEKTAADPGMKARMGKEAPKKSGYKLPERTPANAKNVEYYKDDVDLFDVIKGHFIEEGLTEEEALTKMLDLTDEERTQALGASQPEISPRVKLDERARQLLFEISASSQEDIAIYGPVALAATGDLRALPTLLALSRSNSLFVKLRATRGLADLALGGEHRAQAQLERLMEDHESEVRLSAYQGLARLYDDGGQLCSTWSRGGQ